MDIRISDNDRITKKYIVLQCLFFLLFHFMVQYYSSLVFTPNRMYVAAQSEPCGLYKVFKKLCICWMCKCFPYNSVFACVAAKVLGSWVPLDE